MRLVVLTAIGLCALFFSNQALAQNWFDQVKTIFESDAGRQVVESLEDQNSGLSTLTNTEIGAGLREALRIGTSRVVGQLGTPDGFNLDPKIHIPLPDTLARVDSALSAIGMSALTDDLELRLNRAAEAATPKAKALFIEAISQMSIDDAKNILTGSDNAATQYLRRTMGPGLGEGMQPFVDQALASAGAIQAYDQVMGKYDQIPLMPDVKANLNNYVVNKAMDGIFYYVGQEEAAIRTNPARRTTALLKKVFSSN